MSAGGATASAAAALTISAATAAAAAAAAGASPPPSEDGYRGGGSDEPSLDVDWAQLDGLVERSRAAAALSLAPRLADSQTQDCLMGAQASQRDTTRLVVSRARVRVSEQACRWISCSPCGEFWARRCDHPQL